MRANTPCCGHDSFKSGSYPLADDARPWGVVESRTQPTWSQRENKMRHTNLKFGLVAGVVGTLALALALAALAPAVAAPVSTGATALKSAVASDVIDVRWRGGRGGFGRRGGWVAGGFATGLALGAIASRPYYYDPYYYGPPPAAVYGPPPGPAYVEPYPDPNGPVRQCWVSTDKDRGYGYYRPC
jgi:hypothetical protein